MKKWIDRFEFSELILEDHQSFLLLNKPPGLSSQDDQHSELSLLKWAEKEYKTKFHLSNRLDRPVSGVVLLSRKVQKKFKKIDFVKYYLALVPHLEVKEGTLSHYIKRDGRSKKAIVVKEKQDGFRPAQLNYKLVQSLDNYDLVEIKTDTGRFHQIRAQFAAIGHPLRGDVKYGARRSNKDRSIDLHAYKLDITDSNQSFLAPPLGRETLWTTLTKELIQEP